MSHEPPRWEAPLSFERDIEPKGYTDDVIAVMRDTITAQRETIAAKDALVAELRAQLAECNRTLEEGAQSMALARAIIDQQKRAKAAEVKR